MTEPNTDNTPPEFTEADQLAILKSNADLLGVQYHPNIGLLKLKEKIEAHMQELEGKDDKQPVKPAENDRQKRMRLFKDATKLVRIRITCMNPIKTEWPGEIFTVSNAVVGTVKRFVPFNADDGWHVENIIYKYMKSRKYQAYTTVRDEHGRKHRKGRQVQEFNIELLPPLTKKEIQELARKQAMASGGDF